MDRTSRAAGAGAEVIALRLPSDVRYLPVVRLMLGGLATRIECPIDQLDELQLATETVISLGAAHGEAETVTVEIGLGDRWVAVSVGPVSRTVLDSILRPELDLAHVLAPLVDLVEGFERDDGHWLRLEKRFEVLSGAPR
jgi:hypothetical protein